MLEELKAWKLETAQLQLTRQDTAPTWDASSIVCGPNSDGTANILRLDGGDDEPSAPEPEMHATPYLVRAGPEREMGLSALQQERVRALDARVRGEVEGGKPGSGATEGSATRPADGSAAVSPSSSPDQPAAETSSRASESRFAAKFRRAVAASPQSRSS